MDETLNFSSYGKTFKAMLFHGKLKAHKIVNQNYSNTYKLQQNAHCRWL